ncbi:Eisosome component PIL1-domain-containing protein [Fennellomyces sp. T-0311]|nr:Eisosome component PIL1-domain-containing protein [Fennellomyces sp. T-0311]
MFSFNPFRALSDKTRVAPDKNLLLFLESEKKAASQWARMSEDRRVSANHLKMFGQPLGDDLTDVTSKMGELLIMWATVMTEFSTSYEQYCATMKSIADKEATLISGREKKSRLEEAIEKHAENHPGAVDKLMEMKEQLAKVERKTLPAETDMSNYQRMATREAMYLLLNGMDEMASKLDIISTFGKYIIDELNVTPIEPGDTRPPYEGTERTTTVIKDAKRAVDYWKPDSAKVRRTLTSHHGHNPLVKKLPPAPRSRPMQEEEEPSVKDKEQLDDGSSDGGVPEIEEKPDEDDNASFYSISNSPDKPNEPTIHKPDEPSQSSRYLHVRNVSNGSNPGGFYPPMSPSPNSPPIGPGGFSSIYLDQQNLYQFYEHYPVPQPYEQMAHQHYRPSPNVSPFLGPVGPGGFVLPSANPYYQHSNASVQPRPSVSTSTASSLPSPGMPEPTPSTSGSRRKENEEESKSPESDASSVASH